MFLLLSFLTFRICTRASCMYVHAHVCVSTFHGLHREIRGHSGVTSRLPPCGFLTSNQGVSFGNLFPLSHQQSALLLILTLLCICTLTHPLIQKALPIPCSASPCFLSLLLGLRSQLSHLFSPNGALQKLPQESMVPTL